MFHTSSSYNNYFITELLNIAILSVLYEDAEYLPFVFDICFCLSLRKFDRFTEHQTDRSKLYANSAAPVSQRSWVRIPFKPEFFSGLTFATALISWVYNCNDLSLIHCFFRSSNI